MCGRQRFSERVVRNSGYDEWMGAGEPGKCKRCNRPILEFERRTKTHCSEKCRKKSWNERHRTPAPTAENYPELFALLARESTRYEGKLVGYSLRWLGGFKTGCEFPDRTRVTRRDGVDGSVEFSQQPYFALEQLPRVPLPGSQYRVYLWVRKDGSIERVSSEWCEIRRSIPAVHFYDEQYFYFDPTGSYSTKTTQKWPRGQKRPLPPDAKPRKRRPKQEESERTPLGDVAESQPGEKLQASSATAAQLGQIQATLRTLADRVERLVASSAPTAKEIPDRAGTRSQSLDRLDSVREKAEPSTAMVEAPLPEPPARQNQFQEEFRKLEEELRLEREERGNAEALAKTDLRTRLDEQNIVIRKLETELRAEKEARWRTEAALDQLLREREARLAKRAAQSSTPNPAKGEHRIEGNLVRSEGHKESPADARAAQVRASDPTPEAAPEPQMAPRKFQKGPNRPEVWKPREPQFPYPELTLEALRQAPLVSSKPPGRSTRSGRR